MKQDQRLPGVKVDSLVVQPSLLVTTRVGRELILLKQATFIQRPFVVLFDLRRVLLLLLLLLKTVKCLLFPHLAYSTIL